MSCSLDFAKGPRNQEAVEGDGVKCWEWQLSCCCDCGTSGGYERSADCIQGEACGTGPYEMLHPLHGCLASDAMVLVCTTQSSDAAVLHAYSQLP